MFFGSFLDLVIAKLFARGFDDFVEKVNFEVFVKVFNKGRG